MDVGRLSVRRECVGRRIRGRGKQIRYSGGGQKTGVMLCLGVGDGKICEKLRRVEWQWQCKPVHKSKHLFIVDISEKRT